MKERTLAIIKPTAVAEGHTDAIIQRIKDEGFSIVARTKKTMSQHEAEKLYAIHKSKSFFEEFIDYITSEPVVLLVLERENAVEEWRNVMGATNPDQAAPGTLRKLYGISIGENAVHGSDSVLNAENEIKIFFQDVG